jgi:hypothetical protein
MTGWGGVGGTSASRRIEAEAERKVDPLRVLALDQVAFPLAPPVLELLLARDGRAHILEHLVADEAVDAMIPGEAVDDPLAMLVEPLHQVRRNANVQRAGFPRCEDVDARLPLHSATPTPTFPSC